MTGTRDRREIHQAILVSHTHWDREWYYTFQNFRARLVDVVDALLDLLDADPDYRFVLDGQSILLEDYLAIRPDERVRLADACRTGRVAVGPWYTQPDSFLPHGEAHVRNLLEGHRVAEEIASTASRVAYVPDSYGHPCQFPQLFAGFGLDGFLYWRGDLEATAQWPLWRWRGPDGSEVTAIRLPGGYAGANNSWCDGMQSRPRVREFTIHPPTPSLTRVGCPPVDSRWWRRVFPRPRSIRKAPSR
jgi:alpha-mannosidase